MCHSNAEILFLISSLHGNLGQVFHDNDYSPSHNHIMSVQQGKLTVIIVSKVKDGGFSLSLKTMVWAWPSLDFLQIQLIHQKHVDGF